MAEFFNGLLEHSVTLLSLALFASFLILPARARRRQNAFLEAKFTKIQKQRKTKLITLVHRQESMGFLGIGQLRYIDLNDAEEVLAAIQSTPPNKPIDLMLHTPGGLVLASLQIARALKAHPGPTRVYVPHFAMSGGTMIALAADEIVMNEHAIMGPIDPQIAGMPAASILRVAALKDANAVDDYTMVLADVGEKAINQVKRAARELLAGTVSDNAANNIAEQLATGQWTHDYPIYYTEARELGLNVSTNMPSEIMDLMALFPESLKNRKGVKHMPIIRAFFDQKPADVMHNNAPASMPQPREGVRQISFGPVAGGPAERPSQR